MAGGLKRVAGNKRLYRDLLVQFAAKQKGREFADPGRNREWRPQTCRANRPHGEGRCGKYRAWKVFAAAEKLERAIRDGDAAVPALAEEFARALSRQVQAIQQLCAMYAGQRRKREKVRVSMCKRHQLQSRN